MFSRGLKQMEVVVPGRAGSALFEFARICSNGSPWSSTATSTSSWMSLPTGVAPVWRHAGTSLGRNSFALPGTARDLAGIHVRKLRGGVHSAQNVNS